MKESLSQELKERQKTNKNPFALGRLLWGWIPPQFFHDSFKIDAQTLLNGENEININFNPDIKIIENYGWPISSYGLRYSAGTIEEKEKAPLYKSHKKYGFVEPIKYYVPSIGISEIEKIPKKFNKEFDNDFFIASMGNNEEEGDLSIHHIKLDKELKKILKEDIIVIGERIRDLKYIESLNKIILFIENSPGIGVLSYSGN